MILRVDFTTDDFREFDIDKEVNFEEFSAIFEELTQLHESRQSFVIDRQGINFYLINAPFYLKITHFTKDAFHVVFFREGEKHAFAGNFYHKDIPELAYALYQKRNDDLHRYVKNPAYDHKWSAKDFETTDYTFSQKSILNRMSFYVLIPILVIFPLYAFAFKDWQARIFFLIYGLGYAGIILGQRMYQYRFVRNIIVKMSRNEMKITIDGIEKTFQNSQIDAVISRNKGSRNDYTVVKLKNGSIFHLNEEVFHVYKYAAAPLKNRNSALKRIPRRVRPRFAENMN